LKKGQKVAKIEFYKKEVRTWFLDPKEDFKKKELVFEVRRDYLTGDVSRILPFRRRRLSEEETSSEILEASRKGCPFCLDQITSSTPKFIPEIDPEGRIRRGRAVLFPNSFPYAQYNWVVVLSEEHFLPIDNFSVEILRDGFLVAQEGIERVRKKEPELRFCSINWNYLPQAGGGIFHPHLQVVMENSSTTSHQKVLDGLKRYQIEKGSFFWEDYLSEEVKSGKRCLGNQGNIHFLTAFSPRGILGEVMVLFSQRSTMEALTPDDFGKFSEGLIRVFRFFKAKHIESFNLALFSGNDDGVQSWVYARLCPRMLLPPWNTSDINYFEKLHDEVICVISPEEMCEELKPFFL
jgi:UDPglucose--hexose-1-phosphate uridylyltransferase